MTLTVLGVALLGAGEGGLEGRDTGRTLFGEEASLGVDGALRGEEGFELGEAGGGGDELLGELEEAEVVGVGGGRGGGWRRGAGRAGVEELGRGFGGKSSARISRRLRSSSSGGYWVRVDMVISLQFQASRLSGGRR